MSVTAASRSKTDCFRPTAEQVRIQCDHLITGELRTEEEIEAAQAQLDRMVRSNPETGEAWADIAWLEAEIIEAKKIWAEENGQFGVGA